MNTIRIAISLFILILVATFAAGWIWTGAHQQSSQSAASHIVLALGIAASLAGLTAIWRARPSA